MLDKGFEWALEHGEPHNPKPVSYPWQPPCCGMGPGGPGTGDFRCLSQWEPSAFLPEGDPFYAMVLEEGAAGEWGGQV